MAEVFSLYNYIIIPDTVGMLVTEEGGLGRAAAVSAARQLPCAWQGRLCLWKPGSRLSRLHLISLLSLLPARQWQNPGRTPLMIADASNDISSSLILSKSENCQNRSSLGK